MLKEKEALIRKVMMGLDLLAIALAFLGAYLIRAHWHFLYRFDFIPLRHFVEDVPAAFSEYALTLILAAPMWGILLYRNGIYRSWRTRTIGHIVWIVFKSSSTALLGIGAAFFVLKPVFVNRLFFATFGLLGFGLLVGEKVAIYITSHEIRRRGYNFREILIVGTGRRASEFIKRIKAHPEWGLKITGIIDDEPGRVLNLEYANGVNIIGSIEEIPEILRARTVDEVVFVVPRLRLHHMQEAILKCETEGVKVTVAVDLFDLRIATSQQTELDGIPLLSFKTTVPSEVQLLIKRVMDVLVSGFLIVLTGPIFLVVALCVKLTSPGPVFFKQERVGLNKRRFMISKFRTMYVGAQKKLTDVDIYKEIYGDQWKAKKLQCVTPLGRILRKYSFDELPQLFNVFLGHMSLVGPRPTLPQEVKQYESWHRRRFSMRPGLTCLWQVSGRREVRFTEWMQMDLEYLDHWSLWLDTKILLKTVPAALRGHGAY